MSRTSSASWWALVLGWTLGLTAAQAHAALEPNEWVARARAETERLVATYRACCAAQGAPCTAVDVFFPYPALAKRTLAPMHKQLTPRQRQRLEAAVAQIYARTAQGSGSAFCQAPPTITKAIPRSDAIEVSVEVLEPGEDVPSSFAFVWQQQGDALQVSDLLVEGGSLLQDYQHQFLRIRQKEGTTGLLRRVEARLAQAARPGARVGDTPPL